MDKTTAAPSSPVREFMIWDPPLCDTSNEERGGVGDAPRTNCTVSLGIVSRCRAAIFASPHTILTLQTPPGCLPGDSRQNFQPATLKRPASPFALLRIELSSYGHLSLELISCCLLSFLSFSPPPVFLPPSLLPSFLPSIPSHPTSSLNHSPTLQPYATIPTLCLFSHLSDNHIPSPSYPHLFK